MECDQGPWGWKPSLVNHVELAQFIYPTAWRISLGIEYEGCPKSSGPHAIQVLRIYYIYKMTSEPFNIIPLQGDALLPACGKLLDAVQKRLFIHSGSPGSVWPSAPECPQNESRTLILLVSGLDRSHRDSYLGCRLDGEGFPSRILREVRRLLACYECDSCRAKWWRLSPTFPVCFCEFSDVKCFAKSPYTYRHSLLCPEGPCMMQWHWTNRTLTPPSAQLCFVATNFLRTLFSFTLRLKITNPCIVHRNDALEKWFALISVACQQFLRDVHAICLLLCTQEMWYPPRRYFAFLQHVG